MRQSGLSYNLALTGKVEKKIRRGFLANFFMDVKKISQKVTERKKSLSVFDCKRNRFCTTDDIADRLTNIAALNSNVYRSQGEFGESLKRDNTEPSLSRNALEGVTTNSKVQNGFLEHENPASINGGRYSLISEVIQRGEIKNSPPLKSVVTKMGIFYFDLKYGTTKGKVTAGDTIVKDFNSYYSSETIDEEILGAGNSSATVFSSTLDFQPVRTSTVVVSVVSGDTVLVSGVDNGSGAIAGTGISSGTVNYTTGAIALTFASAPATGTNVIATYQYNSECNSNLPQVNFDIVLQEIRATTRKLKAKWCLTEEQGTLAA